MCSSLHRKLSWQFYVVSAWASLLFLESAFNSSQPSDWFLVSHTRYLFSISVISWWNRYPCSPLVSRMLGKKVQMRVQEMDLWRQSCEKQDGGRRWGALGSSLHMNEGGSDISMYRDWGGKIAKIDISFYPMSMTILSRLRVGMKEHGRGSYSI